MAQVLLLKINSDGIPQEFTSSSDEITLQTFTANASGNFTVAGGGPVLSATGLDLNNEDVTDVNDLTFNDPTTGTINQTAGALIIDDLMAKDRNNGLTNNASVIFAAGISDTAADVDALRLPNMAGIPTATPALGNEGYVVWSTGQNRMYIWDGAAWDDQSVSSEANAVVNSYIAGVAFAANEAAYISTSDTVELAYGGSGAESRMVGFATTSALITAQVPIQSEGVLAGFAGLNAGDRYYLDESTPGAIINSVPTGGGKTIVQVGYARSATKMHIHIQQLGKRA